MKLQAIVTACCRLLGLLLIYHGCTELLFGLRYFFMLPASSQFAVVVFWLSPLVFFAAAFYVMRHAEQLAFHLVGNLTERPADFPEERDFWVHLACVLLALYLIAHALAGVGTGAAALLVYTLASAQNRGFVLQQTNEGYGSLILLLVGLILLRRSGSRLKELSASGQRGGEGVRSDVGQDPPAK